VQDTAGLLFLPTMLIQCGSEGAEGDDKVTKVPPTLLFLNKNVLLCNCPPGKIVPILHLGHSLSFSEILPCTLHSATVPCIFLWCTLPPKSDSMDCELCELVDCVLWRP
jgi:hypothetical protein